MFTTGEHVPHVTPSAYASLETAGALAVGNSKILGSLSHLHVPMKTAFISESLCTLSIALSPVESGKYREKQYNVRTGNFL